MPDLQYEPPPRRPVQFTARCRPADAVVPAVFGTVFLAVFGAMAAVIGGAFAGLSAFSVFGDASGTGSAPVPVTALAVGVPAVLGLVWVVIAAAVAGSVLRGLRRVLIVSVDGDGVTFGPQRVWQKPQRVPWSEIRAVSAYTTASRADDGPSSSDWVQLDLMDGTIVRRRLDRSRYSWAALADAVRAAAPRTPLTVEGVIQAGGGPAAE